MLCNFTGGVIRWNLRQVRQGVSTGSLVRWMSLTHSSILDNCLHVTMASPKTRNSLSLEMINELTEKLSSVKNSPEVRCILIRGEGPAFSAGHNLKEMTEVEGKDYHKMIFDRCNVLMHEIVTTEVPVIAAVDGVAAAAGCQLVAMCDIAVATEKSTFSTPGASVGLFCSTPGIPLARAVPRKISAYMLLTGLPITADEALRSGLISKLVKGASELDAEILHIVEAIKSKPKAVISLGKNFYYRQLELGLSQALDEGGRVMADNLTYKDAQEGISAFKEKRKPSWTHTNKKLF